MRGRVLQYNDQLGQGLISGDDGKRYTFTRGDLQGGARTVAAENEVDFESSEGNAAKAVFVLAQNSPKSKWVAFWWAMLLGGVGAHKFYLGHPVLGILYLLFFWTFIPGIIAFIEAIVYASKSRESFHTDYVIKKNMF